MELFRLDTVYAEGSAEILPTFLGNHDMGRFSGHIRDEHPDISDAELFARIRLGHAMMMFSRGVPTVYYGDEQGFVSDGNDKAARESMFPSVVDSYNDNDLVATDATTADENFDTDHPLYRAIAEMAGVRQGHEVLRRGRHLTRYAGHEDSVYVMSRIDEASGDEVVIAYNAEDVPLSMNIEVDGRNLRWESLMGECADASPAPGSYAVVVPPLDFIVCRAVR